jgi:urease accessory protein
MKKHLILSFSIFFLAPGTVYAHGIFKGLSSFYNGLLHPLFIPAQVILIIALGLFSGKQEDKKHRAFFSFSMAVVLGLLINVLSDSPNPISLYSEYLLIAATIIVATLVILQQRTSNMLSIIIMIIGGIIIGIDSTPDQLSGKEKEAFLLGNIIAVYLLILYPITLAETFGKAFWQEVFIRILGSWLVASALMVGVILLIS